MNLVRIPAVYRRLVITFSPMWRRLYGEITLTTLLELHAARGQQRPSVRERLSFAVAGLRSRLPRRLPADPRSARTATDRSGAPTEMPLLGGGFLVAAALGAPAPAAFPTTANSTSLAEVVRRRRAAASRLLVDALVLSAAVALTLWGPPGLLLLLVGGTLIALAAAVFDVVLFLRLGRRILAEP